MQLDGVYHLGVNVRNLDEAVKLHINTLRFHLMDRYTLCQGQSKFVPVWRSKSVPLGLKNIGY
jgi:hypothetical protein